MCFCGNKCEGYCRLTWVIYKLKCRKCHQTYIGKTRRELRARVSEHFRAVEGRGGNSALCRHPCRAGYEVRICARTENDPAALRAMEGKMMNKYCPKINIRNESRAREEAKKLAEALRKRMGSCNPAKELRLPKEDPDSEDGAEDFWMEESEWYSSEIDVEDENGDPKNSEPDRSYGNTECDTVYWNVYNLALLKAADVLNIRNSFRFVNMDSEEAAQNLLKKKERGFMENLWYNTSFGVWFDDERSTSEKWKRFLGLDYIGLVGVTLAITIPLAGAGAPLWLNLGKAGAMGAKVAVPSAAAVAAYKAALIAGAMTFVVIGLKTTPNSYLRNAYTVEGSSQVILVSN